MPMVARIAATSLTGISGINLGAPYRLINATSLTHAGNNLANQGGMFGVFWQYTQTSAATGAGSATVPCFTWWDNAMATTITATGGPFGGLCNGGVTASVTGAAVSSLYGLTAVASSKLRGFEVFQAASGASGASAYIQVSSLGSGGDAVYRFDYQVFCIDDWAV